MIRAALEVDAAACQAIYAHHVLNGAGTFDEAAPSVEEMAAKMADVAQRSLPWFVAEQDGRVIGFAYASPFRLRSAYRFTAEDTIYVAPDAVGRGVGKALLSEVVEACRAAGLRQLVAVIGDSANAGSIGVHTACGFTPVGTLKDVGFKFGRFVDVVMMQKALP